MLDLDQIGDRDPFFYARENAEPPPDQHADDQPAGVVSWCFSLIDPETPLSMLLTDNTFRVATESELAEHLKREPWHTDTVSPAVLRRLLPDADGEFFALLAARKLIQRRAFDTATWSITAQGRVELDENLRQLCETPVVTDAGAAMRLQLLMSATWSELDGLTVVRTRQLLSGALAWLYQRNFRKEGVEIRELDIEKQIDGLKGYADPPGPRDHREQHPLPSSSSQL